MHQTKPFLEVLGRSATIEESGLHLSTILLYLFPIFFFLFLELPAPRKIEVPLDSGR